MAEQASEKAFPKELVLGIAELDEQHRAFLMHMEALRNALTEGAGARDRLLRTLRYLDRFVDEHFRAEEQYMRLHNYPGILLHRAEHEAFARTINDFQRKARDLEARGEITSFLAVDVEHLLEKWFVDHILKLDRKMADYLRERM